MWAGKVCSTLYFTGMCVCGQEEVFCQVCVYVGGKWCFNRYVCMWAGSGV